MMMIASYTNDDDRQHDDDASHADASHADASHADASHADASHADASHADIRIHRTQMDGAVNFFFPFDFHNDIFCTNNWISLVAIPRR